MKVTSSNPNMALPAYTPQSTQPTAPLRTTTDIRTQILANGLLLWPEIWDDATHGYQTSKLEILVAGGPVDTDNMQSKTSENSATDAKHNEASSSSTASADLHYAVLARANNRKLEICMRGDPRETVEWALEAILASTERLIYAKLMEHEKAEKAETPEKAEMPEKPEKPEKRGLLDIASDLMGVKLSL
jgi:hypothetical protein